jgi:FKBP-type peptidyl-prolyl cis-trans isomerase
MMPRVSCLAILALAWTADSWQSQISRRKVLLSAPAALLLPASSALAQPAELANLGTQAPLPVGETSPFVTLQNGVQVKDFRISLTPDAPTVGPGSRVSFQCTGRLLNLNGVIFYSTKNTNVDGFGPEPLTVTLGKNELLPGLEAGMIGMKKGGIRRIIVPADLAYSKFPDLEPKPTSALDQRALDSVVKNPRRDATILFDVSVERVKN